MGSCELFLVFSLIAAIASRCPAAEAKLTLAEILGRALAANPSLRETLATETQSRSAIDQAESRYYPRLSALGQYQASDDPNRNLPDANQAVVQIEDTLFEGGRLLSDIARLRELESGAKADVSQRRLELALSVKQSYYQAASAAAQIQALEDAEQELKHVLKLIEPRFTVGSVPEYDYVRTRASARQYERQRLEALSALDHELFSLGEAMGSDPPESVAPPPPPLPPPTLDEAVAASRAVSERPDLKVAESDLSAQQFQATSISRERYPTLKVLGDYGLAGRTAPEATLGWGITAQLSIPIFDFGEIGARLSQANAQKEILRSRLEALRLKVRTEVHDALRAARSDWEILRSAESGIPEAERAYQSSLRRYRTGLAQMSELSDAHDLWVQARLEAVKTAADYRIALARLEAVQGIGAP